MLIYCDYIASLIRNTLMLDDQEQLLLPATVHSDLGDNGELMSHRKDIYLSDINGIRYRITIDEVRND